jgi:hypothetical protein
MKRFGNALLKRKPEDQYIEVWMDSCKDRDVMEAYAQFYPRIMETGEPVLSAFRKTIGSSSEELSNWKSCRFLRENRGGLGTILGMAFFYGQAMMMFSFDGYTMDSGLTKVWFLFVLPLTLAAFLAIGARENKSSPGLMLEQKLINLCAYFGIGLIFSPFLFPCVESVNAGFDSVIQRDTAYVKSIVIDNHTVDSRWLARSLKTGKSHDMLYMRSERELVDLRDTVEITTRIGLLGIAYRSDPVRMLGKCMHAECGSTITIWQSSIP